jgi:methionyl-tRNA formyltransferase
MSRAVRVLFAGTPDVALPSLDLLVDDPRFEVVAALTNPDRPRGRSATLVPSPVAERAGALGIPLLRPEVVGEVAGAIAATGADIGAVVAYGSILPAEVLGALPRGFVNLHFSLLPRWRGAAPIQHAIRAGDPVTGVSAFLLDEGMDTGPVLRTLEVPLPGDVDAGDLMGRLSVEGAPVLADALLAAASGEPGVPQPSEGATLAPRIRPEDAEIRWGATADEVARAIRSVTPRPGAVTTLDRGRLKLAGVSLESGSGAAAAPGTIVAADADGLVVACGSGAVRIRRVQVAGRPWSDAADQVRGRRIAVGMLLGEPASRS